MNPWQYCDICRRKGAVPECALCEQKNSRPMTGEEQEALLAAYLQADDDWWQDVPFEDGTTPRQRQGERP